MKIGILGSGIVAKTLGSGFLKYGHEVMLGSSTPEKLADWVEEHQRSHAGAFADAAAFGELLVLAVKGTAAVDVVRAAVPSNLNDKPVIDTTNPIADKPPVHGVLSYFTSLDESLMEQLQSEFPRARFVKAFSSAGNRLMVNPDFEAGKPTMFICGNDQDAKKMVTGILDQFGWETADMGMAEAARAIEPLAMLWCIRGFLHNEWGHAFKFL
ncbi:MAG: NAD(P)-binding domain-containing protein [Rhodothermales bacterium]